MGGQASIADHAVPVQVRTGDGTIATSVPMTMIGDETEIDIAMRMTIEDDDGNYDEAQGADLR